MSVVGRMLRAGRDDGRILEHGLEGWAEVYGRPEAAARFGPCFTCAEADRIAWVLIASRHADAAVIWLQVHARSDSGDDLHGEAGFDAISYVNGGG